MAQKASEVKAPTKLPKRESKVPKDESKDARFLRLAKPRMNRALKALASVANLAGPSYECSAEQATRIVKDLEAAVASVRQSYFKPGRGEAGKQEWSF